MIKVILHGVLGEKFGRERFLDAKSIPEICQAISVNRPKFREFLSRKKGMFYQINVDGKPVKYSYQYHLKLKEGTKQVEIIPIVVGSASKGVFGVVQIVVGALLIAIGSILLFTPAAAFGVPLIMAGVALLASGIITLLTPNPKRQDDQGKSSLFGGDVNTAQQGIAVPVIYGELLVGGLIIASQVQTQDDPTQHGHASDSGGGGSI